MNNITCTCMYNTLTIYMYMVYASIHVIIIIHYSLFFRSLSDKHHLLDAQTKKMSDLLQYIEKKLYYGSILLLKELYIQSGD